MYSPLCTVVELTLFAVPLIKPAELLNLGGLPPSESPPVKIFIGAVCARRRFELVALVGLVFFFCVTPVNFVVNFVFVCVADDSVDKLALGGFFSFRIGNVSFLVGKSSTSGPAVGFGLLCFLPTICTFSYEKERKRR